MVGFPGVDVGGHVGREITLTDKVVALDEIEHDGVVAEPTETTAHTKFDLLRLDRLQAERKLGLVDRVRAVGGDRRPKQLAFRWNPESGVVSRIKTRLFAERVGETELGTQVLEIDLGVRDLTVEV